MDTVLSVAEGQADSEDYYLDLNADAGVEDFDFKLDGVFEDNETQQPPAEVLPEDAANANGDFEIGYEDDEWQTGQVGDKNTDGEGVETSHDAMSGEETGMEYQDEIGYEDEEPVVTNVSAGGEVEEAGTLSADQATSVGETHEVHQDDLDDEAQMLEAALDPHGDGYSGFEEPQGEQSLQSGFDDPQSHMSELDDTAGLEVETDSAHPSHLSQDRTPASGHDGVDESADISNTPSAVPEITVHYNQGQYALVGAPNDDPDSYFLSDEKDLEGSLSEFLASIRAVISDELSSEDELTIRIDALDLEFGERSNQKFLGRNFHEIIACYSALAAGSSKSVSFDPHSLDLELLVRRDCEARFLDLLDEAGIVSELSHLPDHFDNSEGMNKKAPEAQVNAHLQADDSEDGYSEEYVTDNDDAAIDAQVDASHGATGNEKQAEPEDPHEKGDDIIGGSLESNGNPSEPSGEAVYEEQYQELYYKGYGDVEEEDHYVAEVDTSVGVSGESGDGFTADQNLGESELTLDIMEQSLQGQDGAQWIGEASEQTAADVGNTTQAESLSHDDNVALALDGDGGQSTTHERNDAGYDVKDTNTAQNDGETANSVQPINHTADDAMSNESVDASEAKSKHTSRTSTVNGDGIDFEAVGDEFLAPGGGIGQPNETYGPGDDEIDWENDGDEPEQNAALTPPSISGKRNRTNDAESLSDEADYKRRRT